MIAKQRKSELFKEQKALEKAAQTKNVDAINVEIEAFNSVIHSKEKVKYKTAEQLLLEMDNDEDDETEEMVSSDDETELADIDTVDDGDLTGDIDQCDEDMNNYSEKLVNSLLTQNSKKNFKFIKYAGFSSV